MSWANECKQLIFSEEKNLPWGLIWLQLLLARLKKKTTKYFNMLQSTNEWKLYGGACANDWLRDLEHISECMNYKNYQSIIHYHFIPFVSLLSSSKWMFQQHASTCWHLNPLKNSLKTKTLYLPRTSRNLNYNPEENFWSTLIHRVYINNKKSYSVN